ncbi:hypothetical protein K438DRAFT_1771817 [Mycena galopus ATCC 62051]|nr:hypothetical protein K438DRAFT_1771817 [Mycena galopus ATCC 62051]
MPLQAEWLFSDTWIAFGHKWDSNNDRTARLYIARVWRGLAMTCCVIRIKPRLRRFWVPVALPIASIMAIPTPECHSAGELNEILQYVRTWVPGNVGRSLVQW